MSKSSRKVRATTARRGTPAADPRIKIIDKPAKPSDVILQGDVVPASYTSPRRAFTAEELEAMPLTVAQGTTDRVKVWRGPGGWYRHGVWIRIVPRRDGEGSRFLIVLLKGANKGDLDFALHVVAKTRAGQITTEWERPGKDWVGPDDGRTFRYRFVNRRCADPYTRVDTSPPVTVCTEPKCRERWHADDYPIHVLDEVSRQLAKGCAYQVRVTRLPDDAEWTVDVHSDEFFGSPEHVAVFVSDLQWMQEECRRANLPSTAPAAEAVAA